MRFFYFTVLLLLLAPSTSFSKTIVLNGTPMVQARSSFESSENKNLSESEQEQYRLLLTKENGVYRWASRDNREMEKNQSGDVTIFTEKDGAGYVRVMRAGENGDLILYLEHMALGLSTISYWGFSRDFQP